VRRGQESVVPHLPQSPPRPGIQPAGVPNLDHPAREWSPTEHAPSPQLARHEGGRLRVPDLQASEIDPQPPRRRTGPADDGQAPSRWFSRHAFQTEPVTPAQPVRCAAGAGQAGGRIENQPIRGIDRQGLAHLRPTGGGRDCERLPEHVECVIGRVLPVPGENAQRAAPEVGRRVQRSRPKTQPEPQLPQLVQIHPRTGRSRVERKTEAAPARLPRLQSVQGANPVAALGLPGMLPPFEGPTPCAWRPGRRPGEERLPNPPSRSRDPTPRSTRSPPNRRSPASPSAAPTPRTSPGPTIADRRAPRRAPAPPRPPTRRAPNPPPAPSAPTDALATRPGPARRPRGGYR
jgi:hypothetical protein